MDAITTVRAHDLGSEGIIIIASRTQFVNTTNHIRMWVFTHTKTTVWFAHSILTPVYIIYLPPMPWQPMSQFNILQLYAVFRLVEINQRQKKTEL